MSEPERQQVLVEWSSSRGETPGEPVHRLFELRAAERPEAPAVVSPQGAISYGELDRRGNGLARRLHRLGVGPETVVAIRLERSAELVVAALAVLKAGGAYLPIDPKQPRDRQVYMLRDSGARLLLTTPDLLDVTLPAESLCVDAGESADAPPAVGFCEEQLAYVIYTSGSTGEPKGTDLAHAGLSSLAAWHRQRYGVGAADRATLVAGPGFDASVWEVWPYLAVGAALHVPAAGTVESPPDLAAWLTREKITLSFLPTPLAEAVLAEPAAEGLPLRALLTGGDRLHRRPSERLPYALVNHYGPTESTVVATAGTVEPGPGLPTLGRPIANTRVQLLDPGLWPAAAGVAGEICLAGAGLARGYRGRPALTAERFVPDPSGEPGARLYRTGDLARWRADGEIEFLGRIDAQVKIRGYRVETGEIEAALGRHGGVREAAVVLREGRLAAYVVPAGGGGDARALRAHLAGLLPEPMLPASWTFLDALPRSASGKIDRRALPEPGQERGEDIALPRDGVELALVRIWEDVLGVSPVGARDDFFELGGHSLLAVRLIARIARELGGEPLPLAALFQLRTVERIAARLRAGRQPERQDVLVEIQPGGEGSPVFLVHPVGGNVFCYSELARALAGRPCFGIQTPAPGSGLPVLRKLEDMAGLYCARVREAQPSGPYVLGGWSMGGPIALEMARRLRAAGDEVILLLLDPPPPTSLKAAEPDLPTTVLAFIEDLAGLSGGSALGPGDLVELELAADPLGWALQRARAAGWLPPDLAPDQMAGHFDTFRRNLRALWKHRPRRYEGDAILVLTGESQDVQSRTAAWTELLGRAEVLRIPGEHYSLLRPPQVGKLAERLANRIKGV
jgi:amino acid adenylation domain-containing protein